MIKQDKPCAIDLESRVRLDVALSYSHETFIHTIPKLALLLENRCELAKQLQMGNESVVDVMDYIDKQICLLLGLNTCNR